MLPKESSIIPLLFNFVLEELRHPGSCRHQIILFPLYYDYLPFNCSFASFLLWYVYFYNTHALPFISTAALTSLFHHSLVSFSPCLHSHTLLLHYQSLLASSSRHYRLIRNVTLCCCSLSFSLLITPSSFSSSLLYIYVPTNFTHYSIMIWGAPSKSSHCLNIFQYLSLPTSNISYSTTIPSLPLTTIMSLCIYFNPEISKYYPTTISFHCRNLLLPLHSHFNLELRTDQLYPLSLEMFIPLLGHLVFLVLRSL